MSLVLPVPETADPAGVPPLRWGVVGTGIADSFVRALHAGTPQRTVAVTARDPERTAAFAARHGVATVHPDVEALAADPQVDAVYVATPHPLHREHALAAVAAGKHVLVEKPVATSAAEAREILAAARSAGVLAMEAMWTRYLPQTALVRRVLADGLVGDVHLVTADFGFVAPRDPAHRLWDPALGGGALLDAGVYPVSFASSLLGVFPQVHATGTMSADGVDARAHLQLEAAGGAVAQLSTSLVTHLPVEARVMGTAGSVRVAAPFFCPSSVEVTVGGFGAAETATWVDPRAATPYDAMADQVTAFAGYVAQGRVESPLHPHDEVVAVLDVIDRARAQLAAVGE